MPRTRHQAPSRSGAHRRTRQGRAAARGGRQVGAGAMLQLQRQAGNAAVTGLVRAQRDGERLRADPRPSGRHGHAAMSGPFTVQRGKKKNKKNTTTGGLVDERQLFATSWSSVKVADNVRDVGGKPGAWPSGDHIVANKGDTNHHIFPKDALKDPLAAIARLQATLHDAVAKSEAKNVTSAARKWVGDAERRMRSHAQSVGLDETGSSMGAAGGAPSKWYWLSGNIFRGVNQSLRSDEPGNSPEKKPHTMPQGAFDSALEWGADCRALGRLIAATATRIAGGGSRDLNAVFEALAANRKLRAELSTQPIPHQTSQAQDVDWTYSPPAGWGQPAANYRLV